MTSNTAANALQGDLFSGFDAVAATASSSSKEYLLMPDAEVTFYQNFFSSKESDELLQHLIDGTDWRQDKMKLYGREIDLPRKTAWYGDRGRSYTFSGIHLDPKPWTPTLLNIKQRIEEAAQIEFNSVLLNLYRDGKDGISWHTDAEAELGENPVIGSVSFGGARRFMFRHKQEKELKTEVELTHGSFLLMAGETQHFWQHQIPKTTRKVQPRINLTFRTIVE